jgi:hypothetical protein
LKIKRALPLVILTISLMILSACSAAQGTSGQSTNGTSGSEATQSSVSVKLVMGTIMLENTDQKIDAAQAAELLPLWKAVRSLNSSNTTSPEEMNALYVQIQNSMTAEQMKAINSANYSNLEVEQLLTSQGIGFGSASQGTKGSASSGTTNNNQVGMQAGSPGGPPDAGGMPGGGLPGGSASSTTTTNQNASGASMSTMNQTSQYLEALIALLRTKMPS